MSPKADQTVLRIQSRLFAMRLALCLLLLVGGLACARRSDVVADPGPKVKTRVVSTIERFEESFKQALRAQERQDEESGMETKHDGIHTVKLKAASQRRFAQIWWAARYPHGRKVAPSVAVERFTIRCGAELSGTGADAGSDWTDFETRIDDLESGRYRIIAPLGEVTLDVP